MTNEQTKKDELTNQFSKWIDKLVFVEIKSGKKYEGIILKSIDSKDNLIRFLNFEKSWDNKLMSIHPLEIIRIEELNR